MPRTRASAAAIKSEPEKPVETEEHVDFEGDNEEEEEIEYEEVEEEVEMEEEEEEEVEEEVEEEEEEEEEENDSDGAGEGKGSEDVKMKVDADAEDVEKKHAELLALPPHGSEVYIGGITHDVSEADVREFCETIGEVTEVRIMKGKDSTQNKGYAFVTFRNKELASKAIKELNNTELKGKRIKCSPAQAKHRLFIGNVPRNWGEDDMRTAVTNVGPGVITIELVKDPVNSGRNRGFAFIEYYNHACAEYSRQEMSNSDFKLDDNAPTVSWADPKNAETASSSSQVKAVYVKNLPKHINQDKLKELFEHHGKITKVVLPPAKPGQEQSRYGFVHFADRSSAMKALKNTEKYEIDGKILECSLAKPQADQKSSGGSSSQKGATLPTYPPRIGYGMMGAPYGALGAGFGAGYGGPGVAQPMVYGRGATPGGLAMMPMLLPDGRIGYVLQQPGVMHSPPPTSRGGRSGGGGSSDGRRGDSGGRGRPRYNPY